MFNNQKTQSKLSDLHETISRLNEQIKRIQHDNSLEQERLQQKHSFELQQKQFEITHFKDNKITSLIEELTKLKEKNAVLTKENEMLSKITDLNADIIDIKDLVNTLVSKLPEIKISSLHVD